MSDRTVSLKEARRAWQIIGQGADFNDRNGRANGLTSWRTPEMSWALNALNYFLEQEEPPRKVSEQFPRAIKYLESKREKKDKEKT